MFVNDTCELADAFGCALIVAYSHNRNGICRATLVVPSSKIRRRLPSQLMGRVAVIERENESIFGFELQHLVPTGKAVPRGVVEVVL